MRSYEVFISQLALDTAARSGAARRRVMKFIESLSENPYCKGDFSESDRSGRTVQVKIIDRFAIAYWPDHAVAEVKVTHIKPADR